MAQICKDLNELAIYDCTQDLPGLISLIDAQRNLKSLKIYHHGRKGNCNEIGKALARKGNTINELHLVSVNTTIPLSFLTSLINLKKLSISNGENITEEIKKYLEISEFSELQSLFVFGLSCFKELAILIEKTKGNISKIYINITNKSVKNTEMLIKAIANNCPKIKELSTYLEPKDFIYVKSLLLNCRNLESIKFDRLHFFVNENGRIGNELLDILIKFSPKSFSIAISGDWKYSIDTFERFFESCRDRTLFRFDIVYYNQFYITKDHKMIVRKYVDEGVVKHSNCK